MKSLLVGLVFLAACAGSQTHYTNVAAVRSDIRETIAHDGSPRQIVSMGHTTDDAAVVYTQTSKDAPRIEEHWVHDTSGWKLQDSKDQAHM
jgi:hypothetical protein